MKIFFPPIFRHLCRFLFMCNFHDMKQMEKEDLPWRVRAESRLECYRKIAFWINLETLAPLSPKTLNIFFKKRIQKSYEKVNALRNNFFVRNINISPSLLPNKVCHTYSTTPILKNYHKHLSTLKLLYLIHTLLNQEAEELFLALLNSETVNFIFKFLHSTTPPNLTK